jgi:hypothetical protein
MDVPKIPNLCGLILYNSILFLKKYDLQLNGILLFDQSQSVFVRNGKK